MLRKLMVIKELKKKKSLVRALNMSGAFDYCEQGDELDWKSKEDGIQFRKATLQ